MYHSPNIQRVDAVFVPSQVREYVATELAQQLRPQLEAAVKANDDPAGEPYVFNAAACARRTMKNKALVGRGAGHSAISRNNVRKLVGGLVGWRLRQMTAGEIPTRCASSTHALAPGQGVLFLSFFWRSQPLPSCWVICQPLPCC